MAAKSTRLRGPTRPLEQRKADAEQRLELLSKRLTRQGLDRDIRDLRRKIFRRNQV